MHFQTFSLSLLAFLAINPTSILSAPVTSEPPASIDAVAAPLDKRGPQVDLDGKIYEIEQFVRDLFGDGG